MNIKIEGLDKMQNRLKTIHHNLNNIENFKDIPFNLLSKNIDDKFRKLPLTNTGGIINEYKSVNPVKSNYLKQNKHRNNAQLLQNTGELRESFKYETKNNIADVNKNEFKYGSRLDKAKNKTVKKLIEFDPYLNRELNKFITHGILSNKELYRDIEGKLV